MTDEHGGEPGIDDAVLARYLSGECSDAEARAVERALLADPERRASVDALRTLWRRPAPAPGNQPWSVERIRAEVRRYTSHPAAPLRRRDSSRAAAHSGGGERRTPHARWLVFGLLAASVATVAILGRKPLAMWWQGRQLGAVATRDITTARGQRATIHLADGTTIVLDVDSRLTLPVTFGTDASGGGGTTRDVTLRGAAYFDVAHDADHPFRVHVDGALARVLGTQFGVWAYPASPVRVVVAAGRVSLVAAGTPTASPLVLTKGMAGTAGPTGVRAVSDVDVEESLAWKDGHLRFTHAALRDVLPQLERWYDLTIIVPSRVRDTYELTASFGQEPATEAMDVLSAAFRLRYTLHGRTVQFVEAQPRASRRERAAR